MSYILIDDDTLIHELWKMAAKDAGVELLCFESVEKFLEKAPDIPKKAKVYIDSNLKEAVGEEEAHKVFEAGFEHIHIATGYDADSVNAPDFVLGVVGKRPPF